MIKLKNNADCCGCGACALSCPVGCIELKPDREGFIYPVVNEDTCVSCDKCERICPMRKSYAATAGVGTSEVKVYACKNNDSDILEQSSSGGVFSALAAETFADGGVVFGAAFDNQLRLSHRAAYSMDEAIPFRGSKYLQSSAYECFPLIKQILITGRHVLFCGTPCQVDGLQAYLSRSYPNLLLVDCICMGVPSPGVFSKYKSILEEVAGAPAVSLSFRDKSEGWEDYQLKASFQNGAVYKKSHHEDLYMQGFSKRLFLRPTCHDCRFKGARAHADITLGDFWGIKKLMPDFYDSKGVSMILVHTKKGQSAFNAIRPELSVCETDYASAVSCNPMLAASAPQNPQRAELFMQYSQGNIYEGLLELTKDTKAEKLRHTAGSLLRRMGLRK